MSAPGPEDVQPYRVEPSIPPLRGAAAEPWHAESPLRGYITVFVLGMVGVVVLVLAEQTIAGRLTPQEFAEITGPILVGIVTGVVGYLFKSGL